MEVLNFIFGLGIAFSIFGFIWGLFMILLNFITGRLNVGLKPIHFLVLLVIKYVLLVSVVANYILNTQESGDNTSVATSNMILGIAVMALYFMGKFQNRPTIGQFSQHKLVALLVPPVNPKIDGYIFSGSIVAFIVCLQYPFIVDNGIVNWFTASIHSIYNAPILGWIFSAIAFFFLINMLIRAANVIGSILTGQPINRPKTGGFKFGGQAGAGSNPFEQFREQQQTDDGFVDYEDVTDVEDVTDQDDKKLD
ncbi:MAG: hypothetical protein GQ574_22355 [Crocinitomix sp.]|nr:hypothetical protein [Crocinitomix sp.]